ncbi:MAG: M20 family metallopeptidase [Acidimicrobiia bacterium]
MDLRQAKERVAAEVEGRRERLIEISRAIHERPELLYEEHFAADLLATELEQAGLPVERMAYGMDTAFSATAGNDHAPGPTVAVLCEYDALPGIGHGCGHNLIAAMGLGAGLAAAAVAAEAGGRLVVLGTPAEEGGGGKIRLLEAGAFVGVDAAMMAHPAGVDRADSNVVAIATWRVEYEGVGAHAAAAPERGRNALDAAVLGYNAVAALRQHIADEERVHGIFVEAGRKPNIVPSRTVAEWYVRSRTLDSLQVLKERVRACLEAGAAAAGCGITITPTCPEYSELRSNEPLLELYRANSEAVGRPVPHLAPGERITISTDMGNVSLACPSIHPMVAVSPPDVALHTAEFAEWAASPQGERAVVEAATAMAMTAVDVWMQPEAAREIRAAFAAGP